MTKRVKTKGQAALEFLMSYAWAIMIVLVAIGLLAYFGISSYSKILPSSCIVEPGIGCTDFKIVENSVTLVLRNGRGEDINITSINVEKCQGSDSGFLKNGNLDTFNIGNCNFEANKKIVLVVNLTYISSTGLVHKKVGKITDIVELGVSNVSNLTNVTLSTDLVAYWKLNENPQQYNINSSIMLLMHFNNDSGLGENTTFFRDSSIYQNNGVCDLINNRCPNITLTDPKFGRAAVKFDGVDDVINISNRPYFDLPADSSISLWFKTNAIYEPGSYQDIISTYLPGWDLYLFGSGLRFYNGSNDIFIIEPIQANLWYHVALVRSGFNWTMYLNSVEVGRNSSSITSSSNPLRIGGRTSATAKAGSYNGTIDEVSIWNISLPSSEIAKHFSYGINLSQSVNGTRFDSKGNNHLTDPGNNITSISGKIGNAANFTLWKRGYLGISDNTDLSLGSDTNFTITAWVYFNSKPGGERKGIVGKWNNGAFASVEYHIHYHPDSDRILFVISNGGSGTVIAAPIGSPSLNIWYFIAAWHDANANTINIQVDNGVINTTTHISGTYDGTQPFTIGATNNGATDTFFDGRIDEVGFWKRILTAQERADLYNNGNGNTYNP